MKKGITIGAILVALGAALVLWLGGFLSGEQKPTEPKFDLDTAIPLGSASDRTQGLYEVEYYLVQKGPWPNPALLERTVTMYWKQTPTRADVFSVVRIPQFIADRKYVFCQDCPVFVRTLRQPITEPPLEQEPETPAKDEK